MQLSITRRMLIPVLALFSFAAAPALGSARGVQDNGEFFSDSAKTRANAIIDDIFRKHHAQEVLIETVGTVPPDTTYDQWANQHIRESKINGVHVLIVKKGGHVRVAADKDAARLFTQTVRTDLAQSIDKGLRSGKSNWDNTLLNAVQSVQKTFERGEQQGAAPTYMPQRTSSSGTKSFFSSIWGWVCLAVGVWIIIGLVRSVFSGGYGGGGPGYQGGYGPGYGYGGGGGWGTAILGGLFGAMAGNWLYNNMLGGSAHAAPPTDMGGGSSDPGWAGTNDTSQGFDSSDAGGGSDYGDSGGGGDFGGDAGGGGDFGGGDFGGGDFS